ncbi:MAG: hypothetical protein WC786_06635, partial [Patescibacteria group bacterium]
MTDQHPRSTTYRRKLTLTVGFLCVALGLVVLSYPLWPILRYKLAGPVSTPEEPVFPYPSKLLGDDQTLTIPESNTNSPSITNTNT